MRLKTTLNLMDEQLLKDLFDAAQEALNDTQTSQRVGHVLGLEAPRVQALAQVALRLSLLEESPQPIGTRRQLDALTDELRELMA
ncbi:hypothetical protein [Pseudomonas citronellolis]|uniref:hypothetical protein n=1 Tax=Pseudomonas citronellolis TaxID=53408 RepID=UPI0023E3FE54|nr:hypothetical protein [Pseudomonas citronellolis]MDF3933317.1 hypothetical protein [Pseudomonas citronellolis]